MSIDVTILGPIGATVDGLSIPLGNLKQRLFLGILAHDLRIVEKARLIGYLWDDGELPTDPDDQISTYAKGIRSALGAAVPGGGKLLRTVRGTGYQLTLKPEQVDRHRFARLKARAQAAEREDPGAAARFGRRALQEWGNPTGLRGSTPLEVEESRLDVFIQPLRQEYRSVVLLCVRAELACGRHEQLLPELTRLGAEDYGAEDPDLVRLHMIALFRAGMPHEATRVFDRYEAALGKIYGFDATKELKDLKYRILNEDEKLKLAEADYAEYSEEESVEPGEETTPPDLQNAPSPRAAGNLGIQTGEKARMYQATSMVFHENSDDE